MAKTCFQTLQGCGMFLLLLLGLGNHGSAWAENGSAQATMSLIVPEVANDSSATAGSAASGNADDDGYANYVADTSTSVVQSGDGHVTYKVWISI